MDGVGGRGVPQAEISPGGREPLPAAAATGVSASKLPPSVGGYRRTILDLGEPMVPRLAGRAADCATRDGIEMAPQRLEGLLALALEAPRNERSPPDFARVDGA